MSKFKNIFQVDKPIIGMIHLPSLPGYPNHPGMKVVIEKALGDLVALETGGVDAVLIENENDQPHQIVVGQEIKIAMIQVVRAVVEQAKVPVGVEVLLNDPKASLAIAHASGGKFIRTDYFVDRMMRAEYGGEMAIDPVGLLRYRSEICAQEIAILTDIQVKYATMLDKHKSLSTSAKQAVKAGSDGIVVTGNFSGDEPVLTDIEEIKKAVENLPVIVGSGLSSKNVNHLLEIADGAIVGTSVKTGEDVDPDKVSELMSVVEMIR